MAGQQLDPVAWRRMQKQVSHQWRGMDESQKEPFLAKAAAEQALRENTAHKPLAAKRPPSLVERNGEAEIAEAADADSFDSLPRNALKTLSRQRTMLTYSRFKNASDWEIHDGGICCADGAIKLDLIDVSTPDEQVQREWDVFAKPADPLPKEWAHVDGQLHHQTCHAEFGGLCRSSPFLRLTTQFVHAMSDHVTVGPLAAVEIELNCYHLHSHHSSSCFSWYPPMNKYASPAWQLLFMFLWALPDWMI